MPELVLLTGILISGLSVYLMLRTEELWDLLQRVFGSGWLYGAALLRLRGDPGLFCHEWHVEVRVLR